MTRVNLVEPKDLADQHLFAEFRELKMVPAKMRRHSTINQTTGFLDMITMSKNPIPSKYTLGTGHVRFFYNKMDFLLARYRQIEDELLNRNYDITYSDAEHIFLDGFNPLQVISSWQPSPDEIKINVDRIVLRLNERPNWYRYYGKIQNPEFFVNRYNLQLKRNELIEI